MCKETFKASSLSLETCRVCCCCQLRSLLDGAYMNILNVVKSQSTHIFRGGSLPHPYNLTRRNEYLGVTKIYNHAVFLTIQREYLDFILIQNHCRDQRSRHRLILSTCSCDTLLLPLATKKQLIKQCISIETSSGPIPK